MSIGEKQAAARGQVAEPPVACPGDCGTRLMPADLLPHLNERCPGAAEPGPAAKWVTLSEARSIASDVPERTLSFWGEAGDVRTRGGARRKRDRQFLLRDLALRVAIRRIAHRR